MKYQPEQWCLIRVIDEYRIFGVWPGRLSWRINSGIKQVSEDGDVFFVYGYSGSVYVCHKGDYSTNVSDEFIKKILPTSDVSAVIKDVDEAFRLIRNID